MTEKGSVIFNATVFVMQSSFSFFCSKLKSFEAPILSKFTQYQIHNVINFSLDELKYNSLRTYLTIKNLGETKYFTCKFEKTGSYSLSKTLSALIRPTS